MNILMISLGNNILKKPIGDEIDRHLEYTNVSGDKIFMFVYSKSKLKLKSREFKNKFYVYPSSSFSMFSYPFDVYRAVIKLSKKIKFDLIYTQDPFGTALVGIWLRKKLKIPLIIQNHSSFLDNKAWISERPIFFRILNRLAKYTLPKADLCRVVNKKEKDNYIQKLNIPQTYIKVLNVPVNLDLFLKLDDFNARIKLRKKFNINLDTPVLIWVGRPVKVKRIPILLKSFRLILDKVPASKLVIVGDKKFAQENIELEIKKSKLTNSVIWLKEGIKHDELPNFYKMADIYVHTSNYEGFGMVLVEAASSSLPIVSTNTAGAKEIIIDGENGFLVSVDDEKALAEHVIKLIQNPKQAILMGQKGRISMEKNFNRKKNMCAIIDMWHEVINNGG